MRRLLAILLIAACVVKAVPAKHPAHRRAEELIDEATVTVWQAGTDAVQVASEALGEHYADCERASKNCSPKAGSTENE